MSHPYQSYPHRHLRDLSPLAFVALSLPAPSPPALLLLRQPLLLLNERGVETGIGIGIFASTWYSRASGQNVLNMRVDNIVGIGLLVTLADALRGLRDRSLGTIFGVGGGDGGSD